MLEILQDCILKSFEPIMKKIESTFRLMPNYDKSVDGLWDVIFGRSAKLDQKSVKIIL